MNAVLCHQMLEYANDPFSQRWPGIRGGTEGKAATQAVNSFRQVVAARSPLFVIDEHGLNMTRLSEEPPRTDNTEHCWLLFSLKSHNGTPYFLNVDNILRGNQVCTFTHKLDGLRGELELRHEKKHTWVEASFTVLISVPSCNLHCDAFIEISLRSAGFNPSMATSQLLL